MSAAAPTEIELLSHAIRNLDSPESAHVVKVIGNLRLPETDLDRVDLLAAKAREGTLTSAERSELDIFLRVGNFLDQMRAWALNPKNHSPV